MIPRRKRHIEYFYNPVDTIKDTAVGIKLPFSNILGGLSPSQVALTGSAGLLPDVGRSNLFELSYTTEEQATSNLKSLLLTRKGERVMHPLFGTDLFFYVFEQKTDQLKIKIISGLNSDIKFWLPYIIIENLIVDFEDTNTGFDNNSVRISLAFKVTSQGAEQTITIFVDQSGIKLGK